MPKILNCLNNNLFLLGICLVIGFAIGFIERIDCFWDFTNYHYYNAFAFLHNRLNYDIVLGSINSFFNPLIDLPLYFMIHWWNDYPGLIYGLQGLYFGVCLFFFCKICALFVRKNSWQGRAVIALAALLATIGQATWMQIGSSTNEIQIGTFILAGLYFWFIMLFYPKKQSGRKFLLVGLILGAALGLKPTVITYCLSSGLCTIILYKRLKRPLRFIALFALGGLLGYLLTNGWQMWHYWEWYGNPFFPFANGIFHSEYFDNYNYRDSRYIPSLQTFFIYPFIWYLPSKGIILEAPLFDCRMSVYYVGILLFMAGFLFSKKCRTYCKNNPKWGIYYLFLGVSFFLWMGIFSILRYAFIVEMLGAVSISFLTIKLFAEWLRGGWKKYHYLKTILTLFLIFIISVFISSLRFIRVFDHNKSEKYLEVEHFNFPENSIIKFYNFPTSMLLAYWAQDNNIRGLGFNHNYHNYSEKKPNHMDYVDFVERGAFRQKRDKILAAYKGPKILVFVATADAFPYYFDRPYLNKLNQLILKEIEENNLYCRTIKNKLATSYQHKICVPPELKKQILGDE